MPLTALGRVLKQVERVSPATWSSSWGQQSLYVARRNALRASSEMARRRREREEAEEFLRRTASARS